MLLHDLYILLRVQNKHNVGIQLTPVATTYCSDLLYDPSHMLLHLGDTGVN